MSIIPEGTYPAKVVPQDVDGAEYYCQLQQTKALKEYMHVVFEFTEGEHTGTRMGWDGYLTPNALERTVKALKTLGMVGDDLFNVQMQPLNKPVSVVVKHEEYNGVMRARIAWVNGPSRAVDQKTGKEIAARLKQAVAAAGKANGKPAVVKDREPGSDDDELNF